jgi:hypothetical protein
MDFLIRIMKNARHAIFHVQNALLMGKISAQSAIKQRISGFLILMVNAFVWINIMKQTSPYAHHVTILVVNA